MNKPAEGGAVDDDNDDGAAAAAAAPALPPAGRHAATYKLEFIRLREKIDAQRNTIHNLEAKIVNLDKEVDRACVARARLCPTRGCSTERGCSSGS
eukprot:279176-Pleurochrysis_carterae.AAC.1